MKNPSTSIKSNTPITRINKFSIINKSKSIIPTVKSNDKFYGVDTTTTNISTGMPIGLLLSLTYSSDFSFSTTTGLGGFRPATSIKSQTISNKII